MAKKVRNDEDEFEDDLESDNESDEIVEEEESDEDTSESIGSGISDDDDNMDIAIEINEDDLELTDDDQPKVESSDSEEDIVLSKHKQEGKHSLKYDSIFKGKKDDPLDEDNMDSYSSYHKDTIEVDKSSNYYFESIDNEKYIRVKLVKERVYVVLSEHTTINFLNNRRKPSRSDFNTYYNLLKTHLVAESFTNVELFTELSVYFSDNLFNMFKLLDNKWRNIILGELQEHVGKNMNSKDVINRNIYEGTEIEFEWVDEFGVEMIITGSVIETDYINSVFKVDSYENIYMVDINKITKILNNSKFKYNLNKLSNIDFL